MNKLGLPDSLEIRQGTLLARDAIQEFLHALEKTEGDAVLKFPQRSPRQQESWLRSRTGRDGILFVAVDGEIIVGMIDALRGSTSELAHNAEFGVSVLPSWRGRGIGGLLIDRLETWARNSGVTRLELRVLSHNPAIYLYRKKAFIEEGRKVGHARLADNRLADTVLMAKRLE
jgi:GNAT superfamily N-acetyltransferase